MTSAGGPSTAGEGAPSCRHPRSPCASSRVHRPDEPGVHLWRHDGQAVYVGSPTLTLWSAPDGTRNYTHPFTLGKGCI